VPEFKDNRLDVGVYNEATGFLLTSATLTKADPDELALEEESHWNAAVRHGLLLPVLLWQDDSFVARLILGDLNEQEQEEWLGRLTWKIRVPCGELVLAPGRQALERTTHPGRLQSVDIPAGDYLVNIYTLINSMNAGPLLEGPDGGLAEPLGAWFRRSRPEAAEFPLWLHNLCCRHPAQDPGHEQDWAGREPDDDSEFDEPYVDFLIQLLPLREDLEVIPPNEDGWLLTSEIRRPECCPRGIRSDNLWDPVRMPEDLEDLLDVEADPASLLEDALLGAADSGSSDVVHQGDGRTFLKASARRIPGVDVGELARIDEELLEAGFQYLGDMSCRELGGGLLRGYGDGDHTYVVVAAGNAGEEGTEVHTAFESGAWLTTGTGARSAEPADRELHHRHCPGGNLRALLDGHRRDVLALQAKGDAPATAPARLPELAAALDRLLTRLSR
jgi:hypothetical protein